MSLMLQNYDRLHDDSAPPNHVRGGSVTPRVSLKNGPISRITCSLWTLGIALLLAIVVILIVIVTGQTKQSIEARLRNLSVGMDSRMERLSQDGYRTLGKLTSIETSMGDLKDLLSRDSQRIMKEVDKLAEELQNGADSKMMEKMSGLETSMRDLTGSLSKNLPNVAESLAIQTEEIRKMKGSLSSDIRRILGTVENQTEEIQKGSSKLCATGWMNFGGSCYLWSTDTRPWSSAKKECEDRKAHLVVINGSEENIFLQAFSRKEMWWIGLIETNDAWGWVDGMSYEMSPKFCEPGQPDDHKNHGLGGGEDCAQLRNAEGWNDAHCIAKHFYICEKKIT